MTTEADFLVAILAEPHDDTHRLVFADWLEDGGTVEGNARAWFIRHQVTTGHTLETNGEMPPIQFRPNDRTAWATVVQVPPLPGVSFTVSRGFISRVACECAAWQRHGPDLVRSHPVEAVRLVNVGVAPMSASGRYRYNSQHPEPYLWPWMFRKYGGNLGNLAEYNIQSGFGADTPDEVHALVGLAALAWAREEAGLPPRRRP